MNNKTVTNETPSVIYIPDFLSSALDTKTLVDIANMGYDIGKHSYTYTRDIRNEIKSIIEDKLSKYDIRSFISLNNFLYKFINDTNVYRMNGIVDFLSGGEINDYNFDKEYLDVLNILKSSNTMSDNINDMYDFVNADGVIFVILHEGFSNLVIDSKEGLHKFREDLINSMYSNFNDEQVNSTELFKTFLKTQN